VIRHDAGGLVRAIEARGYPPPAIPWLTAEEVDEIYLLRKDELVPGLTPLSETLAEWLLHGRDGLPPPADVVQQAVLAAVSREYTRPEPRPDDRSFGEEDKIHNRLRRDDDPSERNFGSERRFRAPDDLALPDEDPWEH
jgi:hypothetical protein